MPEDFDDLEPGDMSQLDIPWYQKAILKISPRLFMRWQACKTDLDYSLVERAEELFGKGKRIHIQPLSGVSGRGFILFIDNKVSFWFYQNGDHFEYDGFEMGEYDDGDVLVFDGLKQ